MTKRKKHKRDARTLKHKALSSLRRAISTFNSHEEDGRTSSVLLHLQHAGEMLIKAALVPVGQTLFDPATNQSRGFSRCLDLAEEHLKCTKDEIGVFRTVDALRNTEQHWFGVVPEEVLYLESRAFITAFDTVLQRIFDERIANHLPGRVLPVSTIALPSDMHVLFNDKYEQLGQLLRPSKRQRDGARGLIRTMLALEAHVVDEVGINEADVDRVEKAASSGQEWSVAFPHLSQVVTQYEGDGLAVVVKIGKSEGAPVRLISADDPSAAAAIREVDLERRFRYLSTQLAELLGLTTNRAAALKWHCAVDSDLQCMHDFVFGSQHHKRYSDTALEKLRLAFAAQGTDSIYREWLDQRKSLRTSRA